MIVVSISTTYERLAKINKSQFPSSLNISYVLSVQGEMNYDADFYKNSIKKIFGDNILFSLLKGYGLSKNRNNALNLATEVDGSEYIYICDDDVYIKTYELEQFVKKMKLEGVDFAVGKISTEVGEFKVYPTKPIKLNKVNCGKVSSVELVISRELVTESRILFDENFGLGSKFPSGEEFIFCIDALNSGYKGYYYPVFLCSHPPISSGSDFFSSKIKIIAKGAMFYRCFGFLLGILFSILFSIKKHSTYKGSIGFIQFLRTMISGNYHGYKASKK